MDINLCGTTKFWSAAPVWRRNLLRATCANRFSIRRWRTVHVIQWQCAAWIVDETHHRTLLLKRRWDLCWCRWMVCAAASSFNSKFVDSKLVNSISCCCASPGSFGPFGRSYRCEWTEDRTCEAKKWAVFWHFQHLIFKGVHSNGIRNETNNQLQEVLNLL